MTIPTRPTRLAAFITAGMACCAVAQAQAPVWKPEKNIEIVVGLTAGSSQDRGARAIQNVAQAKALLGVNSTVVNRVGGGGNVAWSYLAQHPADAHWIQIASPTILTNYIIGTAQFTHTDYTPLALLGNQYIGFAVRTDPSTVSIGINALGSYLHIVCALTARAAGVDPKKIKLVVFQGGELMTAGLGGHIDVMATVTSNLNPHVQAGKMRLLGISSPRRLGGALANVPTLKEQGVDAVLANWQGGVRRAEAGAAADRILGQCVRTARENRRMAARSGTESVGKRLSECGRLRALSEDGLRAGEDNIHRARSGAQGVLTRRRI